MRGRERDGYEVREVHGERESKGHEEREEGRTMEREIEWEDHVREDHVREDHGE